MILGILFLIVIILLFCLVIKALLYFLGIDLEVLVKKVFKGKES